MKGVLNIIYKEGKPVVMFGCVCVTCLERIFCLTEYFAKMMFFNVYIWTKYSNYQRIMITNKARAFVGVYRKNYFSTRVSWNISSQYFRNGLCSPKFETNNMHFLMEIGDRRSQNGQYHRFRFLITDDFR